MNISIFVLGKSLIWNNKNSVWYKQAIIWSIQSMIMASSLCVAVLWIFMLRDKKHPSVLIYLMMKLKP
ncbi:Uncharacterised protein [Mycobacteroides abscessus subsp. abscessus]|nr:Uncharacterised protein [Mycobacteroides abscessus subsp. abscessus]